MVKNCSPRQLAAFDIADLIQTFVNDKANLNLPLEHPLDTQLGKMSPYKIGGVHGNNSGLLIQSHLVSNTRFAEVDEAQHSGYFRNPSYRLIDYVQTRWTKTEASRVSICIFRSYGNITVNRIIPIPLPPSQREGGPTVYSLRRSRTSKPREVDFRFLLFMGIGNHIVICTEGRAGRRIDWHNMLQRWSNNP